MFTHFQHDIHHDKTRRQIGVKNAYVSNCAHAREGKKKRGVATPASAISLARAYCWSYRKKAVLTLELKARTMPRCLRSTAARFFAVYACSTRTRLPFGAAAKSRSIETDASHVCSALERLDNGTYGNSWKPTLHAWLCTKMVRRWNALDLHKFRNPRAM